MLIMSVNVSGSSTNRVWGGFPENIVVGRCLLADRLTAQRYLDFLATLLPWLLEDVPLSVKQRLWFQHEEAPAH
jgi:hypothetical protein